MNTKKMTIYPETGLLNEVSNDPSYDKERRMATKVCKSKTLGKVAFGLQYLQAMLWVMEKRVAMKMSTMYMAADDFFVESGVPEELLAIAAKLFGVINGKPIAPPLKKMVRFICAPWHARMKRFFELLKSEFVDGKKVVSCGCGSGLFEILALIASGSVTAKLTLMDYDSDNIELAKETVALFLNHGFSNLSTQVQIEIGDIRSYVLPEGTDTVASIGLLHNYFSLDEAGSLVRGWLDGTATTVITDFLYDMGNMDGNDARIRIGAILNITGWAVGPPDGLLFYSVEDFRGSLQGYTLEVYDHGLNATARIRPS